MKDDLSTYKLLDCGGFKKLEQVGPYRLVRPAAQAVWQPRLSPKEWEKADAVFIRSAGGEGRWKVNHKRLPDSWTIDVKSFGRLLIKLTDFGHLGIFPEQHDNWLRLETLISESCQQGLVPQVINLFAYTGGSTLAAARAGAHVVHLDASKTSVSWARDNAKAAGLEDKPIRWIVDDVRKFITRELRRGAKYHGIILDPPSYGRGAKGETWKIEDHLSQLLLDLKELLAENHLFVLLSAHSTGYTPLALKNLLGEICCDKHGRFTHGEMVVSEAAAGRLLPSGAYCLFERSVQL